MWAAARHGEPGARSCAVSANMIMDRTVVAEGSSQSETHPTSTICILITSQWQGSNSYRRCSMLDTFCTWLLLFTVYCVECVCVSRILALAVLTIVQPTLCVALIKTNVHLQSQHMIRFLPCPPHLRYHFTPQTGGGVFGRRGDKVTANKAFSLHRHSDSLATLLCASFTIVGHATIFLKSHLGPLFLYTIYENVLEDNSRPLIL